MQNSLNLNSIEEIAKKYKASINTDLYDNYSIINNINSKYKLTAETAKDFNNASTFFLYSNIKNGKRIDDNELPISRFFGSFLNHYYNNGVSKDEICKALTFIKQYNDTIDKRYSDITDTNIIKNIFMDYYKIDPDTLEIEKNSYGYKIFLKIIENFKKEYTRTELSECENQLCKIITFFSIYNTLTGSTKQLSTNDVFNVISENKLVSVNAPYYIKSQLNIKDNACVKTYGKGYEIDNPISDNKIYLYYAYITEPTYADDYIDLTDETNSANSTILEKLISNNIPFFYKLKIDTIYENQSNSNIQITYSDNTGKRHSSEIFNLSTKISSQKDNNLSTDDSISAIYSKIKYTFNLNELTNINNIYKNYYKIIIKKTNSDSNNEKLSSSDKESYYIENKYNLNIIILNFYVDYNSELYKIIQQLFPNSLNNDDKQIVNISFIYKEFNPEIRIIDLSDTQNLLLGEYFTNKNAEIKVNLYSALYTLPSSLLTEEDIALFKEYKTNDLMIRNCADNEIIGYISGDIIGFGNTQQDIIDIETILSLYEQTRTYFYKVLLNKAMINDNAYDMFCKIYIVTYTIVRFMTSRLDNMHDINKFTDEDCSHFLNSYGLEILNNKIDNDNFSDSLTYKKRLIASYSDIMSLKGSRKVIDKIFDIFNYNTTNLDIYQYNILKLNDITTENKKSKLNSSTIKFVEIPYESRNKQYNFKNKKNSMKKYSTFIKDDEYWNTIDVPESTALHVINSAQSTKYIGAKLQKNIFEEFIKTKYITSLIPYLYNKLIYKFGDLDTNHNLCDLLTITDPFDGTTDVSIVSLYLEALILFNYYNQVMNKLTTTTATGIYDTDAYEYGINESADISNLSSISLFKDNSGNSFLPSLFKTPMINGNEHKFIEFYLKNDFLDPISESVTNFDSYKQTSSISYLPLSEKSDNTSNYYKELTKKCTESMAYVNKNTDNLYTTSIDIIDDALKSISLINLLNKSDTSFDEINAAYRFIKYSLADKITYSADDESDDEDKLKSEFSLSNSNFYSTIIEYILSFPEKYMLGEYTQTNGRNISKEISDALNNIFKTFFTVKKDSKSLKKFSELDNEKIILQLLSTAKTSSIAIHFLNTIYGEDENCIAKYTQSSTFEDNYKSATQLTDIITVENETINEASAIDIANAISKKILTITSSINSALQYYDKMKVCLNIGKDTNNFFEFIKETIKYFISYTAELYKADLLYTYDTMNETIPYSYSISDYLQNNLSDYLYSDESITIDEYEK